MKIKFKENEIKMIGITAVIKKVCHFIIALFTKGTCHDVYFNYIAWHRIFHSLYTH